jgi:cytochrome c551/c552
MKPRWLALLVLSAALLVLPAIMQGGSKDKTLTTEFRTSDRCVACHNELKTSSGEDISIGFQWRASIMANSSRDPYWQGSVRRESIDHPESQAGIEDECSICHMPVTHLTAKSGGQKAKIFEYLPISTSDQEHRAAADGVSCSVCHQIQKARLGTSESFNGNVVVAGSQDKDQRPEYGPFAIDAGHRRVMQSSTGGFVPEEADHIRDSALCGSCHTLKTKALGPGGKEIGSLPEQMPYLEWLHSDYPGKQTCQQCHMPEVKEAVPITALFGSPRLGMRRHDFVGANFFIQRILSGHRDELGVTAPSPELSAAADHTANFLQTESARVSIRNLQTTASGLSIDVLVENLTGHKLPTAYPSRRAWLHVVVRDSGGHVVFESGALNPDGSIVGNHNDADPLQFEPYYHEIDNPQQVQIFEPILKDAQGRVTTGLLSAVGYLKDSRILPSGFDKNTAEPDIAVVGEAASDTGFNDKGALTRYMIKTGSAVGPFHIEAELWYQPIGFRWAHNLAPYQAMEPQRFVGYYETAAQHSASVLARAEAER